MVISEHCSLSCLSRMSATAATAVVALPQAVENQPIMRYQRGLGGVDRYDAKELCTVFDKSRAVKNATDRANEAIRAAEAIFADEMGVALGLSPAAKVALISTIAVAIQAAVAEERERLTGSR